MGVSTTWILVNMRWTYLCVLVEFQELDTAASLSG